jgi:hypothetical protein
MTLLNVSRAIKPQSISSSSSEPDVVNFYVQESVSSRFQFSNSVDNRHGRYHHAIRVLGQSYHAIHEPAAFCNATIEAYLLGLMAAFHTLVLRDA